MRYDAIIIGGGHNGLVCAVLPRRGGAQGARARAPRRRRRRGGDRGVPSGLPQFHRQLHGQPAQPEGHPRPAARRARPAHRRAAVCRISCRCPTAARLSLGGPRRTQAEVARSPRATPSACRRTTRMLERVADVLRDTRAGDAAQRRRRPARHAARGARRRDRCAGSTWRRGASCSISSPRARANCSTAGSSREPLKAALRLRRGGRQLRRARTRPARPTCCCTTRSARSTASAACGATRSAAWARSRRRWRPRRARAASRSARRAGRADRRREAAAPRGVALADGDEFEARVRRRRNLDPQAAVPRAGRARRSRRRVPRAHRALESGSATFRMNVALSELPDFTRAARHRTRSRITAPASSWRRRSLHGPRLDRGAPHTAWSAAPIVEMLMPSTVDDTLAPAGAHVASLFCQHFAPICPTARAGTSAATRPPTS